MEQCLVYLWEALPAIIQDFLSNGALWGTVHSYLGDVVKHPAFPASIIASTVAIVGIRKNRQSSREKNSIDFETHYKTNQGVKEAWGTVLPLIHSNNSEKISKIAIDLKSREYKDISEILNTWERAANGIYHKIYDGKFLYKTYGTTVMGTYNKLRPFIEARQSLNPRFYAQLSRLYADWNIKRAKEDRKKKDKNLSKILKSLHEITK